MQKFVLAILVAVMSFLVPTVIFSDDAYERTIWPEQRIIQRAVPYPAAVPYPTVETGHKFNITQCPKKNPLGKSALKHKQIVTMRAEQCLGGIRKLAVENQKRDREIGMLRERDRANQEWFKYYRDWYKKYGEWQAKPKTWF